MKRFMPVLLMACLPFTYARNTVTVNPDQTVSVNGTKIFPISIYMQSDWAGVKSLGVNTASRPFCINTGAVKQAENNQLYLHYTAGPGCSDDNAAAIKNRNANALTNSITQVSNSDFIFGYGLPDEPVSATGLGAADTQWAYQIIKKADPDRPVFLTDYARDISAYKNSADIFLNDEYPFNNDSNPLYDIKTKLLAMQGQVAPKPVWPIIQTGSQFGVPTNAQIRAETYLSVALGSTGIIFYSYDVEDANGVHNIKTDGDPAYMRNLIAELKQFSPAFLGTRNSGLALNSNDIDATLKDYNGKSYLIAVNKSATSKNITFSLNGLANSNVTVVGLASAGSRRVGEAHSVSASGNLTDVLQGLEAVIYEISPKQTVTDQIVQAENWTFMSGVGTETTTDTGGGLDVGWINPGDWMAYNVNIPVAGTYKVTFRVASPKPGTSLRLEKDASATLLGTVNIPNTGGWQKWTNVTMNTFLPAGSYSLGIATATGNFNINYFTLSKQ